FLPEIIILYVYMKCKFSLSYRELEEISNIRGAAICHATLHRGVIKFVPLIDAQVRRQKKAVGGRWRIDETYIKVKRVWVYLYRAIDSLGNNDDVITPET
ncbi:unnamed protein product, partial [Ectocarpus sp. 12 AP-2014]